MKLFISELHLGCFIAEGLCFQIGLNRYNSFARQIKIATKA